MIYVNVYPDLLGINSGNHVYLGYDYEYQAKHYATEYLLYRIRVRLK